MSAGRLKSTSIAGYARKKTWPIVIKDDTETIDEIFVDKTYLMAAVDDMHEFALAVESNITKSQHVETIVHFGLLKRSCTLLLLQLLHSQRWSYRLIRTDF